MTAISNILSRVNPCECQNADLNVTDTFESLGVRREDIPQLAEYAMLDGSIHRYTYADGDTHRHTNTNSFTVGDSRHL